MKSIFLILLASASSALAFDADSFGHKLNGWQRDGSAHYSLNGNNYRSLKPLTTTAADGNTIVKVTVIHCPNSWAEVPLDLEVTYTPDGAARDFRVSGSPKGQKVDSGVMTLAGNQEDPLASVEAQLAQASEAKDTRKRDLLARIAGPEPVNVAAIKEGLRYNLRLMVEATAASGK